jgi:mycothiol synthase
MSVPEKKVDEQLRMIWPHNLLSSPPPVNLADAYVLRQFRDSDRKNYETLMKNAGFQDWPDNRTDEILKVTLPGGYFVVEHKASAKIVATSVATHKPVEGLPFAGELGWVAGDTGHSGKGLGIAVCSAVVGRFIEAGYQNIYLKTDDFRLPAIKVYLKMGFQPDLFCGGMRERWNEIYQKLSWK